MLVPFAARPMGWRLVATRGAGKSRLVGRVVIPNDVRAGVATVVIDGVGGTIDNALDVFLRLSKKEQKRLGLRERVVYVDVAGSLGYVCPFPLLYRLGEESLLTIAARPIETMIRTDRALLNAPIQGANPMRRIGILAGALLFALGCQLTELEYLLDRPQAWAERIRRALQEHPDELSEAAHYFLTVYPKLPPREQQLQTGSLRSKLGMFADPAWRAVFGAAQPGLTLDDVVAKRRCVLLDFRHVPEHLKRLCVCWVHGWILEWVRRRGPSKSAPPLSLVVDEATYLVGDEDERNDPLADELAEAVQRLFRNSNIWSLYAHQEIHQLNRKARFLFDDLGIQMFGATSDLDTAMAVARRFYRWDGTQVKKTEAVWHPPTMFVDEWTEHRTIEFSREELAYRDALRFLDLPAFTFLLGVPKREGQLPTHLTRVSIADVDPGTFVQEELVAQARANLMRRHSRVADVLAAINARLGGEATTSQQAAVSVPIPPSISLPGSPPGLRVSPATSHWPPSPGPGEAILTQKQPPPRRRLPRWSDG